MARYAELGLKKLKSGRWQVRGHYVVDPFNPSKLKRTRPSFSSKSEASAFIGRIKNTKRHKGLDTMASEYRYDAVSALNVLRPHGVTLLQAALFMDKHLKDQAKLTHSISFKELVVEFRAYKKVDMDAGKREAITQQDWRDIKTKCERFNETFGDKPVATITTQDISNRLDELRGQYANRTLSNFRKVLSRVFAYGKQKGYCPTNPVADVPVVRIKSTRPTVFTSEQMKKLLNVLPSDLVPYVSIGGFAGLRPSEVTRLDWKDIRWEGNDIFVNDDGKTGRRYVQMEPNLRAWLEPYRGKTGKVAPPNAAKRVSAVAKKAKVIAGGWPTDIARHSYGTYHVCGFQNEALTSHQMGNSVQVLKRFYLDAVTKPAAEQWWSITP